MSDLLQQSCRVALAAITHDVGKFLERAKPSTNVDTLESHKGLYCPHRKTHTDDPGRFTHVHAAYTAIALELLEKHFPPLKGENISPFASWKSGAADDSMIDAAAKHHRPETFLQWIVATADRIASGFEREEFERYNQAEEKTATGRNHYTARQLTLFEQIRLDQGGAARAENLKFRYPLKPMSPDSIFPVPADGYETADNGTAQKEYAELWEGFLSGLEKIPQSHRGNLALWLDHFETLWGIFTHAIPSATAFNAKPDVSLYDHARVVAALATVLWRYHFERGDDPAEVAAAMKERNRDWQERKFLLIQCDFFGIQDFIFASGGETSKRAARLLRGRSFYVSLLSECAALKILDTLDLPPTSQVINAAGKFLIVAPNTEATLKALLALQAELDDWFLDHTWGQSGIGIAWQAAACDDFRHGAEAGGSPFQELMRHLFEQLERAKCRRFDLCGERTPALFGEYLDSFDKELGVCAVDGRSPAKVKLEGETAVGLLAQDQIAAGGWLVKRERVLITRDSLGLEGSLGVPIFGYHVAFAEPGSVHGKFDAEVQSGNLLRAWDFSLPKAGGEPLWNGYARRYINGYIPRFDELSRQEEAAGKYRNLDEGVNLGELKSLNHIAQEDRSRDAGARWKGIAALMTLKGDVDNLGQIFQSGLGAPTFAKMAALSRQMNAFFAVYLPWLCRNEAEFKNTYTVFAGGDDFFLIGPWHSQIRLATHMRREFSRYVAENPEVHFSAGLSMTKPGLPVTHLADMAEEALEAAKGFNSENRPAAPKNAVTCYGQSMSWADFAALLEREKRLSELTEDLDLSTGYVYGLLHLVDMAEQVGTRPENALWHPYFAYRTWRMLERRKGLNEPERKRRHQKLALEIVTYGIERHGGNYRVALFNHLYQNRK